MQAVNIFADIRPPGIYKPDYIDALYSFYHEKKPETIVCPPTPEWKKSTEFDLNGDAMPDDDEDGVSAALPIVCILILQFHSNFSDTRLMKMRSMLGGGSNCSIICPFTSWKKKGCFMVSPFNMFYSAVLLFALNISFMSCCYDWACTYVL